MYLITVYYGTPEGTFSFLFLSCTHKLLTRFNNIITRLNDLLCRLNMIITRLNKIKTRLNDILCRLNKLFILFKQYVNSFKRLIIGVTTYRNEPELTETDQNWPKRTYKIPKQTSLGTEMDFTVYRNGAECGFSSQTNTMSTRKGRPGNGRKQVYVCGAGR